MSAPPDERPLVVVLGASGFLGSAVVAALAELPVRLRAVSRRPVRLPAATGVEYRTGDLTDQVTLGDAVRGAHAVLPFTARIRGASGWRLAEGDTAAERVNVGVVRDLVDVLASARRTGAEPPAVLFPGSNTQVGPVDTDWIDGTETDAPQGEYDRQKHTAELLLKEATAAGAIRAASLRLPPVVGPPGPTAEDRGVISTMARRALAGEPLTLWHDGTVRRDFLYVEDAARAFATALGHIDALAGRHYLVGTGQPRSIGDVFRSVADAVARHRSIPAVPVMTVPPPVESEGSDVRSLCVDPSAFVSATGWRAVTPLEAAIDRTVAALAARH
ncbi:NAD-dependent epimerase/dehydratase [Streptomyces sp. ISL-10]|uniref:NAD-dependent epimerase/dehydratase family protein n=1 Tax=Streptomyces sp. ISL-10 TaxID=2819172 RepID=UPI001BE53286|nr:NAD-dependent epimerase/dehydratase [Streptomyces sp. ISL-10]MBT2368639.1 NAD-dependent epimerase/dehydratase [Streptomyces sp. ISL-10]